MEKIDQLKKKIKENKGNTEVDEREFNKLFNGGGNNRGNGPTQRKGKVIDRVKENFKKRNQSKQI